MNFYVLQFLTGWEYSLNFLLQGLVTCNESIYINYSEESLSHN